MPTGCTATIRAAMWTTRPRWLRCAPPLRASACWCLAPGATLGGEEGRAAVRRAAADVCVSANFCPDFCTPDFAFYSSSKRFDKVDAAALPCPLILTSNLRAGEAAGARTVNYDRLAGADAQAGNSVLMLLRLLRPVRREGSPAGRGRRLPPRRACLCGQQPARPHRPWAELQTPRWRRRCAALPPGACRCAFLTPSEYEREGAV